MDSVPGKAVVAQTSVCDFRIDHRLKSVPQSRWPTLPVLSPRLRRIHMKRMKATVFHGKDQIRVDEVERPVAGAGEAVIRVTLTTICGTDLHIVRGEYAVREGLIIGHEPVGVIEELGPGVTGYAPGDRVVVGAITPCGQCRACLSGAL